MKSIQHIRLLAAVVVITLLFGSTTHQPARAYPLESADRARPGASAAASPLRATQTRMARVRLNLGSAAELAALRALGYNCAALGDCTLEIPQGELQTLLEAGFEPLSVETALVLRLPAQALSPNQPDAEQFVHGLNDTVIDIPDSDGTDPGAASSFIQIDQAPANARVTQVDYTLKVSHPRILDLLLEMYNDHIPAEELWTWPQGDFQDWSDGGFDDDPESDWDIELSRSITETFDLQPVNQLWELVALDYDLQGDNGYVGTIDYFEIWVYYEAQPDIHVTPASQSYRVGGSGGDLLALGAPAVSASLASDQPSSPASSVPPRVSAISQPALDHLLEQQGGARVIVHLREALPPGASADLRLSANRLQQEQVLDRLEPGDFTLTRRFSHSPGFAGWVTPDGLDRLLQDPLVQMVYEDLQTYSMLSQSVPLINADDMHALGYSGEGVSVAVLDSGIDSDHPDLADDLLAQKCFTNRACPPLNTSESNSAEDDNGHGTAVAGIITSNGVIAPLGVAPDAKVVAVKVTNQLGEGRLSDWIAGIEWAVDNRAAYDISVINLSLGTAARFAGYCDQVLPDAAAAVDAAVLSGISVFAPAGNDADTSRVSAPACLRNSIAVGGVYDADVGMQDYPGVCTDPSTAADQVACDSNSNNLVDLLAPSHIIRTTGFAGGVNNSFGGTSAAAAHAAAAAALLEQAVQGLTPEMIEARLEISGVPISDARNGLTIPRIDVLGAFQADGLTIYNQGTMTMTVSSIESLDGSCWLSLTPSQTPPFTIPPDGYAYVEVGFDNACVGRGLFYDTIRILSDDLDQPVLDVPVILDDSLKVYLPLSVR